MKMARPLCRASISCHALSHVSYEKIDDTPDDGSARALGKPSTAFQLICKPVETTNASYDSCRPEVVVIADLDGLKEATFSVIWDI